VQVTVHHHLLQALHQRQPHLLGLVPVLTQAHLQAHRAVTMQ
jgi:hypothetical protein